ncbi:DUF982 domain-containing protein [Neorhizobium galegae]|nr:DUF982 domain-containing protein [Neorhizobium galegae]MCQ1768096.1 DUF982 domain-containing protein [Neorhizobium galegae]MCQ1847069.1 DUF982 domain-containing protein [Neorhizobium galegae]
MLVNRWGKPLVLERDGLRVTITSAEEGVNWLAHEPGQANQAWKHAWQTCRAVHEGRLPRKKPDRQYYWRRPTADIRRGSPGRPRHFFELT